MHDRQNYYGLGTSSEANSGSTFSILTEFSSDDFDRYSRALGNALAPTHRFESQLVELNFQSYLNFEKFAGTILGLGRNFGDVDRRRLAESATSQIINWLTSFRLYLDYAETRLKRQYGRDSVEAREFQHRAATAFDESVGYRFVSKFRNYVQHCGPPITAVTLRLNTEKGGHPFQKQTATFVVGRDAILDAYSKWGTVRKDLLAMADEFELRPLAEEAMDNLREIDRFLLDTDIARGAATIGDLREALDLIPGDAEGTPTLFRYSTSGPDDQQVLNLSPQHFTRDMVAQYESVASGEMAPSDLHAPTPPVIPPAIDPTAVRDRFHRESRAIQAMSLWQSEGGGTPRFFAEVNRMIQEDSGVDALLTGMFNMTAVLSAMTAAVLGVAPQSLLGGLLDVYAHQPLPEGGASAHETVEHEIAGG
jgi:hypothetical protein